MGWVVEIEQVTVHFRVPSKEEGLTLARAITNQIEICKSQNMEEWERIQRFVVEQVQQTLREEASPSTSS